MSCGRIGSLLDSIRAGTAEQWGQDGQQAGAGLTSRSDVSLGELEAEIERLSAEALCMEWTDKGLVTEEDAEEERGEGAEHGERSSDEGDVDSEVAATQRSAAPPSAAPCPTPLDAFTVYETLHSCSAVVGMHPDQATEAIVDFALASGKPFAVVPCCVYSNLFPLRRDQRGRLVTSYRDFVAYLIAKDPERIGVVELPFEGKNKVVYLKPEFARRGGGGAEGGGLVVCEPCEPEDESDETKDLGGRVGALEL